MYRLLMSSSFLSNTKTGKKQTRKQATGKALKQEGTHNGKCAGDQMEKVTTAFAKFTKSDSGQLSGRFLQMQPC